MASTNTARLNLFNKDLYATGLILAVVALSYFNALSVGFVSDDLFQIVNNPDIKSLSNIPTLFTTGVWHTENYSGGFYRPLAFATWMLEYSLVGARPLLYHIDNVVLHLMCTLMVYHLVKELAGDGATPLFTAVLFAAHPAHTEAVTWIACRMELMYSLFVLSALWVFIARPRNKRYTVLSCLLFMAGLLCKETAIILPLLVMMHTMIYGPFAGARSRLRGMAVAVAPYALTACVYAAIRTSVMGIGDQGITNIYTNYDAIGPYRMFLAMCQSLYEYIRLSFLPFDQRLEYVFRPPSGLLSPKVILSLAAVTLFAAFSGKILRASRPAFLGVLWFAICLLPVSNIIPAGIIMAERALYLPSLGACLIVAHLASRTADMPGRRFAGFGVLFITVITAAFMVGTHQRNKVWAGINMQTIVGLMEDRVEAFPGNPMNYAMLARAYFDSGDYGAKTEDAITRGLDMDPDDDILHFLRARLMYKQSRLEESIASARRAIALNPDAGYYSFGGIVLQKLRRYGEAHAMLDEAIRLAPDVSQHYSDKGNLLVETGSDDEALAMFTRAIELDPANKDAYLGTGIVLDSKGDVGRAAGYIRKAVEIDPEDPDMHYFLANAYLRAGKRGDAASELRETLRLKPDHAEAARLLQRLGG